MFLGNGVLGWSRRSAGRDLLEEALLGEHFWNSFVHTGLRDVNEWCCPEAFALQLCLFVSCLAVGFAVGHGSGNWRAFC